LPATTGKILKILPNNWFSLESLKGKSIIANILEYPHQDNEVQKSDIIKNYKIKN